MLNGLPEFINPLLFQHSYLSPAPSIVKPPFRETTAKANEVGLKEIWKNFKEIARGAIKIVWVDRSKISASGENLSKTVFYTPVDSFFGGNERELKEEVKKMQAIQAKLDETSIEHLAVNVREVDKAERIKGKYTLEVDIASTDFEKKMRTSDISMDERIKLGGHLLQGLQALHKADYVHGDMKPENCLIYKNETGEVLKMSDFGKAKELGNNHAPYSGNTRFAPPEGQVSKKSDVYGAAMVLIRNLEEPLLGKEKTLISIKPEDMDMPASEAVARY
jgi:hypothetical protein